MARGARRSSHMSRRDGLKLSAASIVASLTTTSALAAGRTQLFQAPRSRVEQAYPNLIHYNKLPKGGHFAAWEQPQFIMEEMRAGFRSLRS